MKKTIWYLDDRIGTSEKTGSYERKRIIEEGKKLGFEMLEIIPRHLVYIITENGLEFYYKGDQIALPDGAVGRYVMNSSHHFLTVLQILENLGVPIFNPLDGLLLAFDKLKTYITASQSDLPIPKTLKFNERLLRNKGEKIFDTLGTPFIVKPIFGSWGRGVCLIENEKQLKDFIVSTEKEKLSEYIAQNFVSSERGEDFRVFVIDDECLIAYRRSNSNGTFRSSFYEGGKLEVVEITDEMKNIALKITKIAGLFYSGIDLFFNKNGFHLGEINGSPAFAPIEKLKPDLNVGKMTAQVFLREIEKIDS